MRRNLRFSWRAISLVFAFMLLPTMAFDAPKVRGEHLAKESAILDLPAATDNCALYQAFMDGYAALIYTEYANIGNADQDRTNCYAYQASHPETDCTYQENNYQYHLNLQADFEYWYYFYFFAGAAEYCWGGA